MKQEKFSPGLLTVLNDYKTEGVKGVGRYVSSLCITLNPAVSKDPVILVSLRCQRDANFEKLIDAGIVVNQSEGEVRTATLPLPQLERLSEEDSVKSITPSHFLRSLSDVAFEKINLPRFYNQSRLRGRNVLIGIIDTGIDARHTAFAGRILTIWDQTIPASPARGSSPIARGFTYGTELEDQSSFAVSQDTVGHGTHVAGIAAGFGLNFSGVAPQAELIVVKTDLHRAHIIDGIYYIFKVADELDRPVVINLSLGEHRDAHDGSDDLSFLIDELSGPGKIVCCAAGNEGTENIHAQTIMSPNQTKRIRFFVQGSKEDSEHFVELMGWYSSEDQLEVAVQSSSGFQTPYQTIDTEQTHEVTGGQILISIKRDTTDDPDNIFYVRISPSPSLSKPLFFGTWTLLLRSKNIQSSGEVNIWILHVGRGFGQGFAATFLDDVHDQMKIGSPGTSARAITVASYTTKKISWTDDDGVERQIGFSPDCISDFSSPGPLRNGEKKPDVAAPGAMIVSSLSGSCMPLPELKIDKDHWILYGSSQATPFITGIVALLLEQNRNLEPEQVKEILQNSSLIPGQPNGTYDIKWGFGLIDALMLQQQLQQAGGEEGYQT